MRITRIGAVAPLLLILTLAASISEVAAQAGPSATDLSKQSQNPVGSLASVPFQFKARHHEQDIPGEDQRRLQGLDARLATLPAAHRAEGRAQRPVHRAGRRGLRGDGAVGRRHRDAQHQAPRGERPDLHELAHDRALLADPFVAAHGPQPHDERVGVHRRGHHGFSELERPHPLRVCDRSPRCSASGAGTPKCSGSGTSAPRRR